MCLISIEKWEQLSNRNELIELINTNADATINDVDVKNPDNPAKLIKAKLITFTK